jgi:uncharacterized protein (DUF885 family)
MRKNLQKHSLLSGKKVIALALSTLTLATYSNLSLVQAVLAKSNNAKAKAKAKVHKAFEGKAGQNAYVEEYFSHVFRVSPSWATAVGFHQYDRLLEDLRPQAIKSNLAANKAFLRRFQTIEADKNCKLTLDEKLDLQMLIAFTEGQIFEQEQLRWLERDPDRYPSLLADSVFSLAKRNFAPASERLLSVCERLEQAPEKIFQAARLNIKPAAVPPIYAQVALEQLKGSRSMIESTIPEAFQSVQDKVLLARYKRASGRVLQELDLYEKFLKAKVLPQAKGQFAIGEANYRRKLHCDEMVDEDLNSLLKRGYSELRRLQARFIELGRLIDKERSPEAIFEDIAREHPNSEQLVASTQNCLDKLCSYLLENNIVSLPSQDRVTVAESPSYLRALTFASMDTPGPYEFKAKEAFYYVTPAEKNWDAKRIEEHLRFFSYADIINTSVHEAYPGHYVQFLWVKKAPSKVRKLLGCSSNAEGWAHYCEEMMVDDGLRQDGSRTQAGSKPDYKLAMVQVHDALLRVCRYIVGIQMHTRGMTFQQGKQFFVKEGYMEQANAERETRRGTKDPTYLVYTLGKLEILKMKEEYKQLKGDKFSLKEFHDNFLAQGFPPLKIVRAKLFSQAK